MLQLKADASIVVLTFHFIAAAVVAMIIFG